MTVAGGICLQAATVLAKQASFGIGIAVSKCAFCGHPDWRHRITDAIQERVDAGEPLYEALEDYGFYDEAEFQKLKALM